MPKIEFEESSNTPGYHRVYVDNLFKGTIIHETLPFQNSSVFFVWVSPGNQEVLKGQFKTLDLAKKYVQENLK